MIHRTMGGADIPARMPAVGTQSGGATGDASKVLSLASLSESLSSATGPQALKTALDFLQARLHLDSAYLFFDPAPLSGASVVAASGSPPPAASLLTRMRSLAARAASSPDVVCEETSVAGSALETYSLIAAPVSKGAHKYGCVIGCSVGRRRYDTESFKLIAEVAAALSDSLAPVQVAPPVVAAPPSGISQVEMLTELLTLIGQASTEDELLKGALDTFMLFSGADMGAVSAPDPRTGKPVCVLLSGADSDFLGISSFAQVPFGRQMGGASESLALYGLRMGSVINLPFADAPLHLQDQFSHLQSLFGLGALVCVPVRTQKRHIAVIGLARRLPALPFDAAEISLMQTAAGQVAVAIERIRLSDDLRKRSLHLATLVEVGRTITSKLDPGVVSEQIAVQIRNLSRSRASMLFYYDPINDRVRLAAQSGLPAAGQEPMAALGRELAQAAAQYNAMTFARELRSAEARKLVAQLDAGGWLAVPFRHRGHRIAVAVAISGEGRQPDLESGELLEQFGSLASVAIQNARVYNKQQAMAKVMQESILMSKPVVIDGLDIGHRLIPAHEVGGDYYDFIELENGNVGVVIADVCGSNVRAATYITVGKHALRAYAREYGCPAEVLSRLNRMVCEESASETFISLFYGIINRERNRISYAVAGHEPPVLYRAGCRRCEALGAEGMLLGITRHARFEARSRTLVPGDLLAMYTDGLTEVRVNGRAFGFQRLKSVLREHADCPAQEIVDSVISSRMRFSENRIPDDMALVLVKPTG